MQRLLVAGNRKEALACARQGQLWGPALVLARQLGDKVSQILLFDLRMLLVDRFSGSIESRSTKVLCNLLAFFESNRHKYNKLPRLQQLAPPILIPTFCLQVFCETVGEMAQRQFSLGSPLRTLHLLLAQQPADVFAGKKMPTQGDSPMAGGPQQAPGVDQVRLKFERALTTQSVKRTGNVANFDGRVVMWQLVCRSLRARDGMGSRTVDLPSCYRVQDPEGKLCQVAAFEAWMSSLHAAHPTELTGWQAL